MLSNKINMSVTIIGTCRNDISFENNNLNNIINYPHSTKEIIQQIKFLNNEFKSEDIEDFRTSILDNKLIVLDNEMSNKFNNSKLVLIEISSRKKYIYKGKYLHHLSVDKRFPLTNTKNEEILNNYKILIQDIDEIEKDILCIVNLLKDKTILWVTHIYHEEVKLINEKVYNERKYLSDQLVNIFKKYNLLYICPYDYLNKYDFSTILRDDLGHYTELGKYIWCNILEDYIHKNIL